MFAPWGLVHSRMDEAGKYAVVDLLLALDHLLLLALDLHLALDLLLALDHLLLLALDLHLALDGGAAVVIRRVYIGSRRDQRLRARGLIARVRGLAEIQCGRPPVVPRVYVRPMLEQQPHARESPRAARRTRRRRPWRRRDGAGLSTARIPPDLVDQARIRVRAFAPPVHGPHWAEEASASRVGGLDVGSRSQR